MASTARYTHRKKHWASMPSLRELARLHIVLTPAAKEVVPDEQAVQAALRDNVSHEEAALPEEIVLWRGEGSDRVVAFVNRHVRSIYVERLGKPGSDPRRDSAIKVVSLGIGSRPDLPSGVEYVRKVRGIWRGLLPRERS